MNKVFLILLLILIVVIFYLYQNKEYFEIQNTNNELYITQVSNLKSASLPKNSNIISSSVGVITSNNSNAISGSIGLIMPNQSNRTSGSVITSVNTNASNINHSNINQSNINQSNINLTRRPN
jgi:hypothetical protein